MVEVAEVVGMMVYKIRSNWSQGKMMMMDVSHHLTMPQAAGKNSLILYQN